MKSQQFSIFSFKYGLDTRREELTSQPGTLQTLQDCFVNSGGEIEKRKGFFDVGLVNVLDSSGNLGTYGLEVTTAGLVTFGSALPYGTAVTQGQPTLLSAIQAPGVTYQQLQHPSIANDSTETYSSSLHRLTSVPFSTNFNGVAFVAATFSDGNTFLYYDGELIQQSANGMVMTGRTALADLANDITRQFQDLDWNATANVAGDSVPIALLNGITLAGSTATVTTSVPHGYSTSDVIEILGAVQVEYNGPHTITVLNSTQFTFTVVGSPASPATSLSTLLAVKTGVTQNGSSIIEAPIGDRFTLSINETSSAGYIGWKSIAIDGSQGNGVKAEAKFQITVNTGTFTVEAPSQSSSATPTIDLCGGAIAAAASATLTASAIANAVNDLTYAHGYSALSKDDIVFVFAPISWGNFTFNLTVTPTTGTVAATAVTSNGPSLSLSPSSLSIVKNSITTPTTVQGSCTVTAAGGTAPYSVVWSEVAVGSGNGITISNPNSPTTLFLKSISNPSSVSGSFKVTVTDSAVTPGVSIAYLSVTLRAQGL